MKKIVLDTNFLVFLISKRVDFVRQLHALFEDEALGLIVLQPCLAELSSVAGKSVFEAVKKYLASSKVQVIESSEKKPDNSITLFASENNAVVCTADAGLRKTLKKKGVQVITLRGATRLILT